MKNIIYMTGAVLLTATTLSCKVNDIDFYSGDQEPRIEFAGAVTTTFSDQDYLRAHITGGAEYKEAEFVSRLIGYLLDSPRTFAVTSEPIASAFNPVFDFDNPYSFPAWEATDTLTFRVKCPEKADVSTRATTHTGQAYLIYDSTSSSHQFAQGRVENLSARVDVVLQIYPSDWNSSFWGAYSTAKYFLMLETFKAVHADIPQTAENKTRISEAYAAYKTANGALYGDDSAADTEISFPL